MRRFNGLVGILRIAACYAVVSCHFGLRVPFSSYAVPVFMFLAFYYGRLASRKDLICRLVRIGIPYVVWGAFGVIVRSVAERQLRLDCLLYQILFGMSGNSPLYFLLLVMICSVIVYLASACLSGYRLYAFFAILIFACLFLQYCGLNDRMWKFMPTYGEVSAGRLVECIPYAVIGHCLAQNTNGKMCSGWALPSAGVFLMVMANLIWMMNGSFEPIGYGYAGAIRLFGAVGLSGAIIGLGQMINCESFPLASTCIMQVSGLTAGIYYSHKIVGSIVGQLVPEWFVAGRGMTLLVFALSLLMIWACKQLPYVRVLVK